MRILGLRFILGGNFIYYTTRVINMIARKYCLRKLIVSFVYNICECKL